MADDQNRDDVERLFQAQDWDKLWAMLDQEEYGKAKLENDLTTTAYRKDLDLGREAAASHKREYFDQLALLPRLWRYSLLSSVLRLAEPPVEILSPTIIAEPVAETTIEATIETSIDIPENLEKIEQVETAKTVSTEDVPSHSHDKTGFGGKLAETLHKAQKSSQAAALARAADTSLDKVGGLLKSARNLSIFKKKPELPMAATVKPTVSEPTSVEQPTEQPAEPPTKIVEPVSAPAAKPAFKLPSITVNLDHSKALSEIAALLAQAGKGPQALELARHIKNDQERAEALIKIAEAVTSYQDTAEAAAILNAILEQAQTIAPVDIRIKVLREIALRLAQTGAFESAEQLLRETWQTTDKDPGKIEDKATGLIELAINLAEQRQTEQASHLVAEAVSLNRDNLDNASRVRVLAKIAPVQARLGRLKKALETVTDIDYIESKVAALQDIADLLIAQGDIETGLQVLTKTLRLAQMLKEASGRTSALCRIAAMLATHGEKNEAYKLLGEAVQTARTIDQAALKGKALAEIAQTLANIGQIKEAKTLIAEVLPLATTIEDATGRYTLMAEVADTLVKLGETEQALELIRTSLEDRYKAGTLLKVATSLAAQENWKEAFQLLLEASEATQASNDPGLDLKRVILALASIEQAEGTRRILASEIQKLKLPHLEHIKGYRLWAHYQRMEMLIDKIEEKRKNPEYISQENEARLKTPEYISQGNWEQAFEFTATTASWGVRLEIQKEMASKVASLPIGEQRQQLLRKFAQLLRADVTFDFFRFHSKESESWQNIGKWLVEEGHETIALELLSLIENTASRILTLFAILEKMTDITQIKEIKPLLAQTLELAKTLPVHSTTRLAESQSKEQSFYSLSPKDFTLHNIVRQWARLGEWPQALEIAQLLTDQFHKKEAALDIAKWVAIAGDWQKAIELIESAEEDQFGAKNRNLGEVADALIKQQEWQTALGLTRFMEGDSYNPKNWTLKEIAVGLAKQQEWQTALEVAQSIEGDSDGQKDLALRGIVGELAKQQEWQTALEVAQSVVSPYQRAHNLTEIAHTRIDRGEAPEARELLTTAINIVQTNEPEDETKENHHLTAKAMCLDAIAEALAKLKDWKQALEVLRWRNQVKYRQNENHPEKSVLTLLVEGLLQAADSEEVRQLLIETAEVAIDNQSDSKWWLLSKISQRLIQYGNLEKALEIAQWLSANLKLRNSFSSRSGVQLYMLYNIAADLVTQNYWEQALELACTVKVDEYRAGLLYELSGDLARLGQWGPALKLASAIDNIKKEKVQALGNIGVELTKADSMAAATRAKLLDEIRLEAGKLIRKEKTLQLLQKSWQTADNVEFLIEVLPAVTPLLVDEPALLNEITQTSFEQVDSFLKLVS